MPMSRQPQRDMKRRQRRQRKVRNLRQRLAQTTNPQARQRIIAKIKKASPTAPVPDK
jgi:indole-3-glycerol phosphate synthase